MVSAQEQVTVKVQFSATRGYHLSIHEDLKNLPNLFIQAVYMRKQIMCTTEEFHALATKAEKLSQQIIDLSNSLVQNLSSKIRNDLDGILRLVDAVVS